MFTPKYYAAIDDAQRKANAQPEDALPPFNLDDLGADSWRRRATLWLTARLLPPILYLFREFWPIARIGRFVIVTRDSDVRDVLDRADEFEVPFAREMKELAGGDNFVLGLDGPPHKDQGDLIKAVIGQIPDQPPQEPTKEELLRIALGRDDAKRVERLSRRFATALLRASGGRIDVMKDYITRVAAESCIEYFGLAVNDPDAFAEWAMSVSALLFADPFGDAATRRLALNGAARIGNVIDQSRAQSQNVPPDSVLSRLISAQAKNSAITDGQIRAILVGLITGFIPTNTLAAGKILEELLRRPDALRDAIRKARAARAFALADGDAENTEKGELQDILFEALRLNPPLSPGQWRYVKENTEIGVDGSRRVPARKDSVVLVATMSALRDRRAMRFPGKFMTGRPSSSSDLVFGDGTHKCSGRHLAMAQITEIFMILLSQANIRRRKSSLSWWGGIRWVGPFPRWLDMDFEPVTSPATQTMVMICAPLAHAEGYLAETVKRDIAAFGNPAGRQLRSMLDETGIVHFASLSLIEAGDAEAPAPHLLLELNVDGTRESAIRAIADADARPRILGPIFEHTPMGKALLVDVLRRYALDLETRPWGAIGLNFNGTSEFPVTDIARQDKLASFAKDALASFLRDHAQYGNRAMQALDYVRRFIHGHPMMRRAARKDPEFESLLTRGMDFADDLIIPSRKRLQISDWEPRSKRDAFVSFAKTSAYWRIAGPLIVLDLLMSVAIFRAVDIGFHGLAGAILLAVTGGLAATVLLVGLVVAGFFGLLYYHEQNDIPDDREPPLDHLRAIARIENPSGFVQNHFMAVTELKPGWFRKFTLALSLWGIKHLVTNLFRPGFVLDMGTIHYAKWFRLPGHDKLIFQSNYDGSWESYLEDFIMKAHLGQTAAWSNGVGFPRTQFLVQGGAEDGDRFKRWVRRQQVLSQFWYSRFPELTTDQIRNNALIHDGLARASTESAAQDWLDCFGSMPRPDYAIETEEVQSLVFRGQRYLTRATFALISLPDNPTARHNWLKGLVSGAESPHGKEDLESSTGREVTFGDHPFSTDAKLRNTATFVAFSAAGLEKLELPGAAKRDGLATFPGTFNLGMANRGRSLGDFEDSASAKWRWADADCERQDGTGPAIADAILMIYADDETQCDEALARHAEALGGEQFIIHRIDTQPAADRIMYDPKPAPSDSNDDADCVAPIEPVEYEHFGFHDGISQPVIRGTQRFSKDIHTRDIVEPGEFILGYRNNQGYYPPTATVRAESDLKPRLPTVLADIPSRFPSFEGSNTAVRDFGRNGTFLAVRQLAQKVDEFREFLEEKAVEVEKAYPGIAEVAGAPINAKWVAAKMMGRWPDGTPLVLRPGAFKGEHPDKRDTRENDFSYGIDDPQGLRCPFGAHIRRANPRDSMQPEDPTQQLITNRHRLLRRGRTYAYQPPGEDKVERGLLFTCLCADLDRQFEFVQQTWIGSPSFHGLRDEPDPIAAWHPGSERYFTIPTPSGPVRLRDMKSFVTVRAGGYFFMPSRSAILYLVDLSSRAMRADGSHLNIAVIDEQFDTGHQARICGSEKERHGGGRVGVGVGGPAEEDIRG